jgi:hypothetical protein
MPIDMDEWMDSMAWMNGWTAWHKMNETSDTAVRHIPSEKDNDARRKSEVISIGCVAVVSGVVLQATTVFRYRYGKLYIRLFERSLARIYYCS